MDEGRSMRAVEGSLGHSQERGGKNWKALARANGTSREIDCEAIGGVGRVKNICQWVGG